MILLIPSEMEISHSIANILFYRFNSIRNVMRNVTCTFETKLTVGLGLEKIGTGIGIFAFRPASVNNVGIFTNFFY